MLFRYWIALLFYPGIIAPGSEIKGKKLRGITFAQPYRSMNYSRDKRNGNFDAYRRKNKNIADKEVADLLELSQTLAEKEAARASRMKYTWPIQPGPITCHKRDGILQTFPAQKYEYNFVLSLQRMIEPEPGNLTFEYICTCVVYDESHVLASAHCLRKYCDNFDNLFVVTDRDLCHVKNFFELDNIVEHENFNPHTRINDIALIRLKARLEIAPAAIPVKDAALGDEFFAVGYGEIVWKRFEKNTSKRLQKVPVSRYRNILNEEAGTVFVTTEELDLTGTARGDFGGALINAEGKLVGLQSRPSTNSANYEVYIRLRTYQAWIKSVLYKYH